MVIRPATKKRNCSFERGLCQAKSRNIYSLDPKYSKFRPKIDLDHLNRPVCQSLSSNQGKAL